MSIKKALPYVRIPAKSAVYRFGTPVTALDSQALLRFDKSGWTVDRNSEEGWAVVGDSEGRRLVVETLLSRHRIHPMPPPPGPFPYITSLLDNAASQTSTASPIQIERNNTLILDNNAKPIRHLAFARPPPTGEFTDFTARYGSLQEEDRLTFRDTLSALHPTPSVSDIERVSKLMNINHLLDLPFVSFSSGQTRRARIAAGLLSKPALLILEDPMSGLDVGSRDQVARLLGDINAKDGMRVVLVLRGKGGDVPEWITDICEARNGDVWIGSRSEWEANRKSDGASENDLDKQGSSRSAAAGDMDGNSRKPVVHLNQVSVSYGEGTRKVLDKVTWTIKPGDKWHLQGANGSGKTTLLSLVLGHHPQSYSLPESALTLFSKSRRSIPSPILKKMIGHTSPEIFASFPRGMGLTAYQSIGTGFEGVFSYRSLSPDQKQRVIQLITYFQDYLKPSTGKRKTTTIEEIANTQFSHFPANQQALLLFLRAVVGRPGLLILDEPSQGMDENIWERCKVFLREEWASKEGKDQAVVVVSHYEDEVPWRKGEGMIFKLDQGMGVALSP